MGEWRKFKFSEVIHLISGGTPQTSVQEYWNGEVPWLSVADFTSEYRWVSKAEKSITKKGLNNSNTNLLQPQQIIISARGTIGALAQVKVPMAFNQSCYGIDAKKEYAINDFIYYFLKNTISSLKQISHGAVFDTITKKTFEHVQINLPSINEQRRIARILGTLDDKIELNRKMNETLEAMARALFQSWFVDFDPVRAKLDGRKPVGMDEETAALFPDEFEESELGLIPKGWMVCSLYDTSKFINGAAFRSEDFCGTSEGLPVIKIAELKDGISDQTKFSQRKTGSDQLIDTGDLLYSWSGSPDTSLDTFIWTKGHGLLNQHIFKVVAPSDAQKRLVYYLLKYLRPILVEIARNKQTTGLGHVTVADMKRLQVCWPPKDILAAFDWQVGPIFGKTFANTLESQTLTVLRDTLLPKLMNGEIELLGKSDESV